MDVSAAGSASLPVAQDAIISVLKASSEMQADMVETLLSVGIENQISAQKMAIAGQIIDVYA
jgi:hypothetical protein